MNTRQRENARDLVREINTHGYVVLWNPRSDVIELYRFPISDDSVSIPTAVLTRLRSQSVSIAAWLEESAL
jgi:hypothetical protein